MGQMSVFQFVCWCLRLWFVNRDSVVAENLALRQQLAVAMRSVKRVKLKKQDRAFWVMLKQCFPGWRSWLIIVQPATVCRWHRLGFRLFWRWKSTWGTPGRPKLGLELRALIRRMSRENPTWGAARIRDELALLGYDLAASTVARYMVRLEKPPSPSWKSFLANHARHTVGADFFVVPTATFRLLYCFVILHHATRRLIHFNVTLHPTTLWTGQQVVQAFPFETAPKYLLRDNDSIYGQVFQRRVASLGMEEVRTAFQSPWQNPFVERLIGSVRRECLDHVIVLSKAHLQRILTEYFAYYNDHRAHQSLDGDTPRGRNKEPAEQGEVIALPILGGLHHRYTRRAA